MGFQTVKLDFCSLLAHSRIYKLQIGQKFFLILASYILQGVTYLVHDAQLYVGFWKDSFDSNRKTFQIAYIGNKNVLYVSVREIRKNTEPEVGVFTFRYIPKRSFLPSFPKTL